MTDMQDRIERAARWLHFDSGSDTAWADLPDAAQYEALETAEELLRLAFPELFDTPTHWIAPMVATEAMLVSRPFGFPTMSQVWTSMRTAYLNQKDSEG